jgi:hypothetical protein
VLPNRHTLATYLELVLALKTKLERFDECQCQDDDIFFCRTWVPSDGHYCWLKGSINVLPMEQKVEYFVCTIRPLIEFLNYEDLLGFGLGYISSIVISFIGFISNI